jgi:hypothetical protein
VSGTDHEALARAIATVSGRPGVSAREAEPSLEDVFIHMMRGLDLSPKPEGANVA